MDELEEKINQDSREAQKKLRCDPKQLEFLKKCSEKKDISEWNNWRDANRGEEIWLQGVDLFCFHLEGVILQRAHFEGANLNFAHLGGADIRGAHLEGANLTDAHLEEANLTDAHLEGVKLWLAHLEEAELSGVHLEGADLWDTCLKGADLYFAHLEGAKLRHAHLEEADLTGAFLEAADFTASIVDGSTLFWYCKVDRKTDFRGVGLGTCRIDEGTKYLLEYNRRRLNWEDWYTGRSEKKEGEDESEIKWVHKMRQLLTSPVRLFWFLSDYGGSTIRILLVFFALAFAFAVAYWAKPDCVMVNGQVGALRNFLHSLYFSVVTMTTLGFGDIAANPQSSLGQVLLMLQVFCGYFLLGAIVTRLSILFTAGGPAGRFSKRKNEQIER